jgi:hypothetical protein
MALRETTERGREGELMSIESLLKAADAAGYAMAAPDDDPFETPARRAEVQHSTQRVVVIHAPSQPTRVGHPTESLTVAAEWIKGHLPSMFGGRAPA